MLPDAPALVLDDDLDFQALGELRSRMRARMSAAVLGV